MMNIRDILLNGVGPTVITQSQINFVNSTSKVDYQTLLNSAFAEIKLVFLMSSAENLKIRN